MTDNLHTILFQQNFQNKKITKKLEWIAMSVGCNIKYKAEFKDPIKLISLALIILSTFGLGGQYYHIWIKRNKPMSVYSDAILTSFQTLISFTKLLHFAFNEHKFEKIVRTAKTSELLQDLEILRLSNIYNFLL